MGRAAYKYTRPKDCGEDGVVNDCSTETSGCDNKYQRNSNPNSNKQWIQCQYDQKTKACIERSDGWFGKKIECGRTQHDTDKAHRLFMESGGGGKKRKKKKRKTKRKRRKITKKKRRKGKKRKTRKR